MCPLLGSSGWLSAATPFPPALWPVQATAPASLAATRRAWAIQRRLFRPETHTGGKSDFLPSTHIQDVVNVILFEQLRDVVLVGHSYGGMVISGVAERVPERIAHRVYIDAFVPEDGESVSGEGGPDEWIRNLTRDGLVVPPWVRPDQEPPHDVPHPLRSFTDQIRLQNEAAKRIPTTYILTLDPGAETDDFSAHAARARARGWAFEKLETDHNPQWSKPAELTDLLEAAPTAGETD